MLSSSLLCVCVCVLVFSSFSFFLSLIHIIFIKNHAASMVYVGINATLFVQGGVWLAKWIWLDSFYLPNVVRGKSTSLSSCARSVCNALNHFAISVSFSMTMQKLSSRVYNAMTYFCLVSSRWLMWKQLFRTILRFGWPKRARNFFSLS